MTILIKESYSSAVPTAKPRTYKSPVRQRQAGDARLRIIDAACKLLEREGFARMTIEAIAQRAEVSAQSVYAIFRSKTGILTELLDQSSFGPEYEEVVRQVLNEGDPTNCLRLAARVARQVRGSQSAVFDLLRGAGVVAPELVELEQQREGLRYQREKGMITFLAQTSSLRSGLDHKTARDICWMLTGGDVYRMLVRERGRLKSIRTGWLIPSCAL